MTDKILLLVGTKKGAFILESDKERRSWSLRGPYCQAWPINHAIADEASGTIFAGGGNTWFGPAVWKSDDLGATGRIRAMGSLTLRARAPSLRFGASLKAPGASLLALNRPASFKAPTAASPLAMCADCETILRGRNGSQGEPA